MDVFSESGSASFQGRWQAKKARALARRKEQMQDQYFGSSTPTNRITQPPGGSSSFRLGGSAILRGLPERPECATPENQQISSRDFAALIDRKLDQSRNNSEQRSRMSYEERLRPSLLDSRQYASSSAYYASPPPCHYKQPPISTAHPHSTALVQHQQVKPSTSSNVWANQNLGNFIADRPTSRILNPPGGRSSISFG